MIETYPTKKLIAWTCNVSSASDRVFVGDIHGPWGRTSAVWFIVTSPTKRKIKMIPKFYFYVKLLRSQVTWQFHEIFHILILTLKECIDGCASKWTGPTGKSPGDNPEAHRCHQDSLVKSHISIWGECTFGHRHIGRHPGHYNLSSLPDVVLAQLQRTTTEL